MREQMELIKSNALDAIEVAETSAELNDVRVRFLGKSGEMTNVMKGLATVPKEEKPAMGKLLNEVRFAIENALDTKTKLVVEREKQARLKAQREADFFKRKYFEYYDDIKISHREDW